MSDTKTSDISIDELLQVGLRQIQRLLDKTGKEVQGPHAPSREVVMNLKDIMKILQDLNNKEKGALGKLTKEELEKLANPPE